MANVSKVLKKSAKLAVKSAIRVLPTLPAKPARLTGKLAKDGGLPVRDQRFRPWPSYPNNTVADWTLRLGPQMGRIFLTGAEGLPQTLAKRFAERWAEFCGARYGLLLPHGTDALRVAVAAALESDGLDYGGEIIVPNLSFIASASTVLDRRCGIALVDVDPDTFTLDPRRVEEAIIPGRTRAIMAVHLFGQPCDMAALRDIARRHSLRIIEDAAQAHGAVHELGRAGSLGDAAGFSFQSWKNLSSGEGGAFTTNDPEIFERAHAFHNVGRARQGGSRWGHESLGFNLRASEYVAAVLLHRLRTLEAEQATRAERFKLLREEIAGVSCVEPVGIGAGVVRHGVHMFVMRYRPEECDGLSVEDFLRALEAEGLPVARGYTATMAQQPALRRVGERHPDYLRVLETPVADEAVRNMLFLPHNLFLGTEADMREIAAAFAKVQANYAPDRVRSARTVMTQPATPATLRPAASAASGANGNGTSSSHAAAATAAGSEVRPIRFGIIGVGVMGREHATALAANPSAKLVAVADAQPKLARKVAGDYNCRAFDTPGEMIRSGEVEAVVIATPHWQHGELAAEALRAGLHVVCEKPLTVTVAEADALLRVAAESRGMLAVVHQKRFEAPFLYAKQLLESGELGEIYRCSMVESAWRSEAYYRSSPWRGTWRGEGGGVLLNQAPHLLDRYAWLCGMPESLHARVDTNLHEIEVEDTASAILRHRNGAHGYIHISTVEAPAVNRTVISCDRGRVTIENGRVFVSRLRDSLREKTATDQQLMGHVEGDTREVQLSPTANPLAAFYDDFAAAVAGATPLSCGGEDGRNAVELANAMILSSERGEAVSLPIDREAYARLVEEKMGRELQAV